MKTLSIAILLFAMLTNANANNHRIAKVSNSNNIAQNNIIAFHHFKKNPELQYLPTDGREIILGKKRNRGYWDYKEQLDSIVFVDDSKFEYTYNNNGNVTLTIYSGWDAGLWMNLLKFEYTYDNSDNMTLSIVYTWEGGQWVNYLKHEYTYNNSSNIISSITNIWTQGEWIKAEKYEYTYDSNSNMISNINCTWSSGQWENVTKIECNYDTIGIPTLVIIYEWELSGWVNSEKDEYIYDNSENKLLMLSYDWADSVWVNFWKAEYTYNNSGNTTLSVDYTWKDSQWVNYDKIEYSYDNSGNMILSTGYEWEENQWIYSEKSEVFHDFSVSITDVAFPVFKASDQLSWIAALYGPCNNKPDSSNLFIWNTATNNWDIDMNLKSYYSPFIVPILNDHPLAGKDRISPLSIQSNNTGSLLYFTNHSGSDIALSIYSINGKIAKQVVVPKTGMVTDISHLASGFYFIQFTDRNTFPEITSFVKQ